MPSDPDPTRSTTPRGFTTFLEITDSYGASVIVRESSAALAPHVWLFLSGGKTQAPPGTPGLPAGYLNDGSAHLSLEQATRVRDALTAFITECSAAAPEEPDPTDEATITRFLHEASIFPHGRPHEHGAPLEATLSIARRIVACPLCSEKTRTVWREFLDAQAALEERAALEAWEGEGGASAPTPPAPQTPSPPAPPTAPAPAPTAPAAPTPTPPFTPTPTPIATTTALPEDIRDTTAWRDAQRRNALSIHDGVRGTCVICGGPPESRYYAPGALGTPVTCSSNWHDEDASEPGR